MFTIDILFHFPDTANLNPEYNNYYDFAVLERFLITVTFRFEPWFEEKKGKVRIISTPPLLIATGRPHFYQLIKSGNSVLFQKEK